MPIYEYRCEDCGRVFEMLRRISDADSDLKCPSCDSEEVVRQLSCFATSAGPSGGAASCGPSGGGRRFG